MIDGRGVHLAYNNQMRKASQTVNCVLGLGDNIDKTEPSGGLDHDIGIDEESDVRGRSKTHNAVVDEWLLEVMMR
eukprot:scaffold129383_cov73-Cyclotella_meneghiniana.AAC.1